MSTRSSSTSTDGLACPSCGTSHAPEERFCARCGMPLVAAGRGPLEDPVSEAHGRARKIDPRYTQGELVRVAGGRNQAEAELIQGILLEEGVPSVLRRSAGFDVPDFLAAGPRDVLVAEAAADVSRELLRQADLASSEVSRPGPRAAPLAAAIVLGGGATALIAWLLIEGAG